MPRGDGLRMNRISKVAASLVIAATVGVAMSIPAALAAGGQKVDCDKVMSELHAGKKPKDIAKELNISKSSVYRCRRKERKEAKKKAEKSPATTDSNK